MHASIEETDQDW